MAENLHDEAQSAWLMYRDGDVMRHWPRRQLRRREFVAGYLAARPRPSHTEAEDRVGWYEWIKPGSATTHVAYVHESGEVYDPEHGWNPEAFVLASAAGRVYPLVRADRVASEGSDADG